MGALAAGAVVLAAGAFLLGRGTTPTKSVQSATALSSTGPAPTNASCATPRRAGTAGTLKSVSGGTLVVTPPKGNAVTVKTSNNTKVTMVDKAALSDVTVGATVAVRGTASGTSTIAATQVAVLPPGPSPANRPSAPAPGPLGAGNPGGGARGAAAGIAIGTVKSVTGSSFTVASGSTTVTVNTTSSTTFVKTVQASVGDLVTGKPVVVTGTPNSDGSITALTIQQNTTGSPGAFGLGGVRGFGGFGGRPGFGRFGPRGPGRPPASTPPASTPPSTSTPTTTG